MSIIDSLNEHEIYHVKGTGEFRNNGYSVDQHVHELNRDEYTRKKFAWVMASDLYNNHTLATGHHLTGLCASPNPFTPTGQYHLIILNDIGSTDARYLKEIDNFWRWMRSCEIDNYQFETIRYGKSWADLLKYEAEKPNWFELFLKKNYRQGDVLIKLPLPDDEDRQPGWDQGPSAA